MAGEMTLQVGLKDDSGSMEIKMVLDIRGILPPPFLYLSIEEIGLFKCCIFIDTPPKTHMTHMAPGT